YKVTRVIEIAEVSRDVGPSVELSKGSAGKEVTVIGVVCGVKEIAANREGVINSQAAGKVSGVVRLDNRSYLPVRQTEKAFNHLNCGREITGDLPGIVNLPWNG